MSGRHARKTWPPCAICGDPDGPIPDMYRTPSRTSLARFGLEGEACRTCYQRLSARRKAGNPISPDVERLYPEPRERTGKATWPACVVCGDPGGELPPGSSVPQRTSLAQFGIDGPGCRRCYCRLWSRDRRNPRRV